MGLLKARHSQGPLLLRELSHGLGSLFEMSPEQSKDRMASENTIYNIYHFKRDWVCVC